MPPSLNALRILMGLMCIFFSYYFGRALALRLSGLLSNARLMRWALRVTVTALGAAWTAFDRLAFGLLSLAALAAAAGFWQARRPRKPDDGLTSVMFPKQ